MKALIQRVNKASVEVESKSIGSIEKGYLILLGVGHEDAEQDIEYLVEKIVNLRIFTDDDGKFNLSLLDIKGACLVVSQFTLFADCKKGRRPSFTDAASPEAADDLYKKFMKALEERSVHTESGEFGAYMKVSLENDGPVTIMLDSKNI